MKKISEIMDELGFDPEGSPTVKEAFVKYLIRQSEGVSVLTPTEKRIIKENPGKVKALPESHSTKQMSFDFYSDTQPKSGKSNKVG